MPANPFEGLAAPNPFASVGAANPFASLSPEPERGFLGTLLHETGRDIAGFGKTLIAPWGSALEVLGLNAPITLEDLDTRDLTGAAMIASMFVGGIAAAGAKSVLAGQGLKALGRGAGSQVARREAARFAADMGFVRRAALFAGAEAGAGAFFGSVKPLDANESRLGAVLGDSALFAGFGGAFSMAGSAVKATVGQRLAVLKGEARSQLLAGEMQREQTRTFLQEFAGVRFRASTGSLYEVKRLADGTVRATTKNGDSAATQDFASFGEALAEGLSSGHTERLGVARSALDLKNVERLDPGVLAAVEGASGDIPQALGQLDLGGYKAVRELIAKHTDADRLIDSLGVEAVTESITELGEVVLSRSVKQEILSTLPRNEASRLGKLESDSAFLREAIRLGAVDIQNIADATQARTFLRELAMNEYIPDAGFLITAAPSYDISFLSHIITPKTLAKIHPEIMPLYQLSDAAVQKQSLGQRAASEWIDGLLGSVPKAKAELAVRILDDSQKAGTIAEVRALALTAAEATGDSTVLSFIQTVTSRLNHYRLRAIGQERLGASDLAPEAVKEARRLIAGAADAASDGIEAETAALATLDAAGPAIATAGRELLEDAGRAGYFPIVNLGGYRLDINGERVPQFFKTFNDALKAAGEAGEGTAFISPASASIDAATVPGVSGREFGRLVKALREAEGYEISAREAAELLKESGTLPTAGPRKYSRFLQPRRLGVRDFAEDPFTALRFYTSNMERTLAFDTLEREAEAIIGNIPSNKRQLAAWAEDRIKLMLGKPTRAEELYQNLVEGIPGLRERIGPRTLKSMSQSIRHFQSVTKLGGIWSGAVNATQIAVNTVPVIGAKHTSIGLREVLFNKRKLNAFLAENGIDLGLHVPLTETGELVGAESIGKEIKAAFARASVGNKGASARAAAQALENMWMFSFNGAERMNRLVTFWGAYKLALDERKMTKEAALSFAEEIVEKTQFNYRASNIPSAFAGPIGGVLGQFKTYFVNEAELIASLDNKTRLKMLFAFQTVGGIGSVLAVPGLDLVNSASRFMFDTKMSEALTLGSARAEARGETAGGLTRFTAFGAPGLLGIDMSNYVGPGGFSELMRGWAGPGISDIATVGRFLGGAMKDIDSQGRVSPSTYNAFLQRAMPAQIRRLQRGLAIIDSGEVRNPYSAKLIYRPEDRMRVGVMQAIGAPDVRLTVERTMDEVVNRKVEGYREARESYRKQIGLALLENRHEEARVLQERARAAGVNFDARDLRSAVRSFSQPAAERRERRSPVDIRDDLREFYGNLE
jgi:hypothetical protein